MKVKLPNGYTGTAKQDEDGNVHVSYTKNGAEKVRTIPRADIEAPSNPTNESIITQLTKGGFFDAKEKPATG